jgi:murein DD-endopeptidase MepM/ murein hydrolase activator NlpD
MARFPLIRVVTGATIVGLTIAALRSPSPVPGLPGALLTPAEPDLQPWAQHDTLEYGETLAALLTRSGLSAGEAATVIAAATPIDHRRIPAGMAVVISGDTTEAARPKEIRFQLAVDRIVRMTRAGDLWTAEEQVLPWTVDTVLVRATVASSLYEAVEDGARDLLSARARSELAWTIADIYEYRVDMSRELQEGDEVRVLFERSTAPNGAQRVGTVFAAGLQRAGREIEAIRLVGEDGRTRYYDQEGRSLATAFLKAPLQFRRISSNFGRRKHPVLGTWRQHQGMDYAANSGTPVRSIGDGVVIFAGRKGGYGNAVEVRHPNGFVTRYGHLRGFAKGISRGARVDISETIGYVGMTGLATGPHLHFEVLVNGVQRDPRRALDVPAGPPLKGAELEAFRRMREGALFALAKPTGIQRMGPVPATALASAEN